MAKEEHFSHREAFTKCLRPIRIVQIENSERVIVEIDIVPESEVCKNFVFPVRTAINAKNKYWLRSQKDGARTVEISDLGKFLNEESPKIISWRYEEEERIKEIEPDVQAKFDQLLCKGERFINVSTSKPLC